MCEGVVVRRGSFCVGFFCCCSFFLLSFLGGVCVRVVFKKIVYLFVDV